MKLILSCGLFALLATVSFSAAAEDSKSGSCQNPKKEKGTWSFVWENDYFAQTDRNYTNGLRLSHFSGCRELTGISEFFARDILGVKGDARIRRGLAIGHSIFTPRDIGTSDPLPDQHPYAGWLYGEYSALIERDDNIDHIAITAGVVGPGAAGEFVQNNWHRLIKGERVNGWDNQLRNEPGFILSYDKKRRWRTNDNTSNLEADFTAGVGASAGNVHTNARIGITMRAGQFSTKDFAGPPRVRPSLSGSGSFSGNRKFGWYVFAGVEGRAVAHNIFLDGSLFRENDPMVSSKVLVGDVQAGLVLQIRGVQLAYTHVLRTKEFDEQVDRHRFGAVSISKKF